MTRRLRIDDLAEIAVPEQPVLSPDAQQIANLEFAMAWERCMVCHGSDLNGGEEAPALFGANFMANWNGLTVGDLAERIRISMPPSNPDINNAQQRADIISVILNANGYPTGQKELESRVELLKQIKIEPRQ